MAPIYSEPVRHFDLRQTSFQAERPESLAESEGNLAGHAVIVCCRLWPTYRQVPTGIKSRRLQRQASSVPQNPNKPSFKGPLLFGPLCAEIRDSLTSKLRSGAHDAMLGSELAELGGRILESDSEDFDSWSEQMVIELGESVRPYLSKTWRDLPASGRRIWEASISEGLTQTQRVLLLLAHKSFVEKWKKAEDGRMEQKPDRYEQYLMNLLNFKSLPDLEAFLNGPSHPGFLNQSQVPDDLYEADEALRNRESLEEVYETLAGERRQEEKTHRSKPQSNRVRNYWKDPLWSMAAISTVFVLFGLPKMPYSYYMFLRLVLCVTSVYGFSRALEPQRKLWRWIYGTLALLYNPFFPIRLGSKSVWEVINLATLVLFWAGAVKLSSRPK